MYRQRLSPLFCLLLALSGLLLMVMPLATGRAGAAPAGSNPPLPPIIFVARAHLATPDTIFSDELGPAGQFGTGLPKYAPNSLLVRRDPDGSLFVYNTPGLVDVQSPDASFDGQRIVFAGATTLNEEAADYGWRLYEINVNGSGFHQLTFSDRDIEIPNADQFGNLETYRSYHDLFPAYLADGRIVFNSSRYPTRAHYDERPSFNLYVMNGDGGGLHRITTERGGLLHPTPLPDGRILVARWWNQFNQPSDEAIYNRIDNADENQTLPDGTIILANPDEPFNPARAILSGGYAVRDAPNTWHLMVLNPDGSEFKRLAWTPAFDWALTDDSGIYDTYTGAQPAPVLLDDTLYVAFTSQQDSTMVHTTLETGIRVARPGVTMMASNAQDAIAGLTYEKAWGQGDDSPPYAIHPWGLPDGRILYSLTREDNSLPSSGSYNDDGLLYELQGSNLQYELHVMNLDGSGDEAVPLDLAVIGRPYADAMDAKPIVARSGWTALSDAFTAVPSDDPRWGNLPNSLPEYWFSLRGPDDIETATVHNPNVYANPLLDYPFVNNSPPPGSVAWAEIWVDANQFTGAYCYDGWPQSCDDFRQDNMLRAVFWERFPVTLAGAFTATVPADTMSFVVLRDANGRAVRGWERGYVSIAQGSAYARPGESVTCIGCHMGHVSGSLGEDTTAAEAGWTNVAPYAAVTASSFYDYYDPQYPDYRPFAPQRVRDRRGWVPAPAGGTAPYQDEETGWISELGQSAGEWVQLTWPNEMLVRSIRLVGPPPRGGDWDGFGEPAMYGDYAITGGSLALYRAGQLLDTLAVGQVLPLADGGTLITLPTPLVVDEIRFTVNATTGRWWWDEVAALNEIEVTGRAAEAAPLFHVWQTLLPWILR